MTPDLFFANIIEAINSVTLTVEDSDDVIMHRSDSSNVIKEKSSNLPTGILSPESNPNPDFEDVRKLDESLSSSESTSSDSEQEWFYSQKIKKLNSDRNFDNNL